jgi:hypothetical protein
MSAGIIRSVQYLIEREQWILFSWSKFSPSQSASSWKLKAGQSFSHTNVQLRTNGWPDWAKFLPFGPFCNFRQHIENGLLKRTRVLKKKNNIWQTFGLVTVWSIFFSKTFGQPDWQEKTKRQKDVFLLKNPFTGMGLFFSTQMYQIKSCNMYIRFDNFAQYGYMKVNFCWF